jgi:hypothetical protein
MANEKPFTDAGSNRQSPTVDDSATLLVGAGIDASSAGALAIGGTNATTITIGRTGQTLVVAGDLSVTGTTTSSSVVDMEDRVIRLGVTNENSTPTVPVGVAADRGESVSFDASIVWDETASRWKFCLIDAEDDTSLSTYQTVQALRFDAPTFGRADAGALAIGGSATSIVLGAAATFAATQTGTIQKKTVTVAYNNAALTATSGSANGTAASVDIDTALPANARIVGVDMRSLTPFTGGSVASVSVDVGSSGDVNAIVAAADVQTAAVDGGPATMPLGVRPWKTYASSTQLVATFTPDASHKLSSLTAGSVVIDVLYTILA